MPRYNLPRQSFRHRFFARNLASRERAGFQGFATRSQGLEREKVNHDLTRSPVVARSPRPYLPPSLFPSFPFPRPRHDSRPFSLDRPVSFFRFDSSSSRRDRENFAKTIITNGRTNRERKFIPPRRQVASRIFLSIVLSIDVLSDIGYSVLCSGVLPFSLSPSFPAFAGFLLYAARANIRRRVERENLERNARSKRISLGIYEVRELRRDVRTSCATHACSNFNRTWLASEISPSILYPASFFTRYRLLQNSRDRIKFNDRVLNVLRGTAEFQINCLGLHGNDRTRTRDRRLLESLAAVDVALSEVVSSRGKSFFFFFPFLFCFKRA